MLPLLMALPHYRQANTKECTLAILAMMYKKKRPLPTQAEALSQEEVMKSLFHYLIVLATFLQKHPSIQRVSDENHA